MHGPCQANTFNIACPHFGDGMTLDGRIKVHLVDDVAKTFRLRRRRAWRRARDAGLAEWEVAGLKFVVEEGTGRTYTKADYDGPGYYISPLAISKSIRLIRDGIADDSYTDMAAYNNAVDGSVAAFTWDTDPVQLQYHVCHEVGHCLGLNHRNVGVMAGWPLHPDQHDLDSVRSYYHIGGA